MANANDGWETVGNVEEDGWETVGAVDQPKPSIAKSKGTLSAQDQAKVDKVRAFEESPLGKITGALTLPGRFITGQKTGSEELSQRLLAKEEGRQLSFTAEKIAQAGFNLAPWLIGAGPESSAAKIGTTIGRTLGFGEKFFSGASKILTGATILSGITGMTKTMEELAKGETLPEAAKSGVETGKEMGVIDIALRGVGAPAVKGLYAGAKKLAEPVVKSRAAEEILSALRDSAQDAKFQTKKAINVLTNKMSEMRRQFELKKGTLLEEATQKAEATKAPVEQQLEALSAGVDKAAYDMVKPMTEALPAVKKAIGNEYKIMLDKEGLGGKDVEIPDATMEKLLDALDLTSLREASGKTKFMNIAKALLGQTSSETEEYEALSKLAKEAVDNDGNISFKDTHWLKQALFKVSSTLKRDSASTEKAIALSNVARELRDVLDKQSNSEYIALSKKYSKYLDIEDFVNHAIGGTLRIGEETTREGVTTSLLRGVSNVLKSGGELTDPVYQSQQDAVRAFYRQADLLRENGLTDLADKLDAKMSALVKKVREEEATKIALKGISEDKTLVDELTKAHSEAMYNAEREAAELRTKQIEAEGEQRVAERVLRKEEVKHDDMQYLAFSVAVNGVGGLLKTAGLAGASSIGHALIGLYGIKKYSNVAADTLVRAVESIKSKINSTPLPAYARQAYIFLLNKLGGTE